MERVTNTYSENIGFSQEAVISKTGSLLGSIIAVPYWANSLARGAFNYIKIGVRYASRCLPQGVSLKISRAVSVIGTSVSNSRFGSATLSFCSAHPAFVASLAILALVASNSKIRGFVKTLLKLFLMDLPLAAFSLLFIVIKIIFGTVKGILTSDSIKALLKSFLAARSLPFTVVKAMRNAVGAEDWSISKIKNFAETFRNLCKGICSLATLPLVALWDFLVWMKNFIWNYKGLIASFIMGMGLVL